jgi:hypothetical protein
MKTGVVAAVAVIGLATWIAWRRFIARREREAIVNC